MPDVDYLVKTRKMKIRKAPPPQLDEEFLRDSILQRALDFSNGIGKGNELPAAKAVEGNSVVAGARRVGVPVVEARESKSCPHFLIVCHAVYQHLEYAVLAAVVVPAVRLAVCRAYGVDAGNGHSAVHV